MYRMKVESFIGKKFKGKRIHRLINKYEQISVDYRGTVVLGLVCDILYFN